MLLETQKNMNNIEKMDEMEQKITYFIREKNKWIQDKKRKADDFINDSKTICSVLSEKCHVNKDENCENTEKTMSATIKKILEEKRYLHNKELYAKIKSVEKRYEKAKTYRGHYYG